MIAYAVGGPYLLALLNPGGDFFPAKPVFLPKQKWYNKGPFHLLLEESCGFGSD